MKTFDLEKAKAGASICTREGSKARKVNEKDITCITTVRVEWEE